MIIVILCILLTACDNQVASNKITNNVIKEFEKVTVIPTYPNTKKTYAIISKGDHNGKRYDYRKWNSKKI